MSKMLEVKNKYQNIGMLILSMLSVFLKLMEVRMLSLILLLANSILILFIFMQIYIPPDLIPKLLKFFGEPVSSF